MTVKTIKISREVHKQLKKYGDGKTFNETVKELLANADDVFEEYMMGEINFSVDEELIEQLIDKKVYPTEPYSSVLYRLLHQND